MVDKLTYYSQQSVITDPGKYIEVFDGIDFDIDAICEIVQGLLLHPNDAALFGYQITEEKKAEMNARTVENILNQIFRLNSNPISCQRSIEEKMIGTCRDFSVLACSILRYLGIPSRVRYGFSRYYYTQFFHDIVVLEYWCNQANRWHIVDARTTSIQVEGHRFQVDFNLHDIPASQFIAAGNAWLMCRNHEIRSARFGSGRMREIKGLWYVRNKLMQDLAALNKAEMLPWDSWGYILENKFGVDPTDASELQIMDQAASIINNDNQDMDLLKSFYTQPLLKVNLCSQ